MQALTAVALLCGGDYSGGAVGVGPTKAVVAVRALLLAASLVSTCESCRLVSEMSDVFSTCAVHSCSRWRTICKAYHLQG